MQKYTGRTVKEALTKARYGLGEEAVILNTEYIQDGPQRYVEVIAAPARLNSPQKLKKEDFSFSPGLANGKFKKLEEKIDYLKESVDFIARDFPKREEKDAIWFVYNYLLENEIEEIYAKQVANLLRGDLLSQEKLDIKEAAKKYLRNLMFACCGIKIVNSRPKVIALAGPTGVGKTTTIAKLAAEFTFNKKLKVAIISMDAYRIGAEEQLKTYGKIMKIPVEAATNAEGLKEKIEKNRDKDIILIDTTGRSQHDQMQIYAIADSLSGIKDMEVCLTMSLNTKYKDMLEVVENFQILNYKKIIFTKVDETRTGGALLNISARYKIPIAYITDGQNVPQDIKKAEAGLLVDFLLRDLQEVLR